MYAVLTLWALLFASLCGAAEFEVAPVGRWVNVVEAQAIAQTSQGQSANGVRHLLVDRQWQRGDGGRASYAHFVTHALNPSGVEESSHIAIDFDPEYEALTLHQIVIHRDGERLDRINRSQINLIQRERGLDDRIYDGTQTLNVFIDDVRVGDSVEYSYTIRGANPVLGEHFSAELAMQWSVPVQHLYYRVHWESAKKLFIRAYNTSQQPMLSNADGVDEFVWEARDVTPLVADPDLPDWYEPYPVVYLSDMRDWAEVVAWAVPLYAETPVSANQRSVIDDINSVADTPVERIASALNFVQDEVRYLGIEMGPRSHRPREPDDVLHSRFGDCKDKSRLLVSLLRGMGIDAVPALVNTVSSSRLTRGLPTPTAFNHVIVRASVNGRVYWLDPTRSFQGNDIENLAAPDFGSALPVDYRATGLVGIHVDESVRHETVVEELFDLRDAVDEPASYRVETRFKQAYAESLRGQLEVSSVEQLQKDYLNYYARYYPAIHVASPISIDDDRSRNTVSVSEHYGITDVWRKDESDQRYLSVAFVPFAMTDHIKDSGSRIRSMPLAVSHPVRYRQKTRIRVPRDSHFDNEHHEIANGAFRFVKDVSFADGVLQLEYQYESLRNHVPAADVQDYSDDLAAALNLAAFQIQLPRIAALPEANRMRVQDANWPIIAFVVGVFVLTIVLAHKYIHRYDPVPYAVIPDGAKVGISGWLLLPAIGIALTPARVAFGSSDLVVVFHATQWSIVGDQLGGLVQAIVLAEAVVNTVLFVVAVYVAVAFFTRRTSLPRLFVGFLLFAFAVTCIDYVAIQMMPAQLQDSQAVPIRDVVRAGFSAMVWTAYFLRSKRVRATFTRRFRKPTGEDVGVVSA
ncbi:MAG: DUF3857 domain-containing protein [Gammaproteobacteria bacterium]|nr:DUF3857 domain-containing protein [Gammaproteobacteria bacterium]